MSNAHIDSRIDAEPMVKHKCIFAKTIHENSYRNYAAIMSITIIAFKANLLHHVRNDCIFDF